MTLPTIISVWGAHGTLGAEIARLGVAISYQVWGFTPDGLAPSDEPWVQGVVWKPLTHKVPSDSTLLIVDPKLPPPSHESARVVILGEDHPIGLATSSNVILDVADVMIERAAMAALRCAVEDERSGHYTASEVDHIGDAMMIQ